jgi:two-component system sensor histidine kinase PilS (NtrC family)
VSNNAWRALFGLNLYRWVVAVTLTLAQFSGYGTRILGISEPRLFSLGCAAYLAFAVLTTLARQRRWPTARLQLYVGVCGDVALITVMAYAAIGVSSGLAMLLLPSIAATGVLRSRRMAMLVAALASIALLYEETLRGLQASFSLVNYTQTGILGALFFLAVLVASLLEERLRTSEALATRRGVDLANMSQLNERILQHMQAGVVVVEYDGRIRMANDAARALLKLPAATGFLVNAAPKLAHSLQKWRNDPAREPQTYRQEGGPPLLPHYTRLGAGTEAPVLIMLDDANRINRQVQQMKLASLGRLSASIAHEIRNPLGAISHAEQLLAESEGLDESQRRLLEILRRHTTRINAVVENVLQLSRRDSAHTETLALRPWLLRTIDEYAQDRETQAIRFDTRAVNAQLSVSADPVQMQQIVCNLWDNSLRHGSGGSEVVITLASGRFSDNRPCLDITDNGPGIPPEEAAHIFDPFYTTGQHGTGLGLYLAQELCASNNARLECLPHAGGARFRIVFTDRGRKP